MKNKLIAIIIVIMVLVAMVPVQSFAVDPVSVATMANALAQAITAYGASQGVSITFDVTNTDGIGKGVKELWDNFKADMESDPNYSGPTIQTYDTMSVGTWATFYKKIGDNVGIELTAEVKSVFDGFWNWLLSGPAEMTKVDNQYYQWTTDNNNNVAPIQIYNESIYSLDGFRVKYVANKFVWSYDQYTFIVDLPKPAYLYMVKYSGGYQLVAISRYSDSPVAYTYVWDDITQYTSYNSKSNGWYQAWPVGSYGVLTSTASGLPLSDSMYDTWGSDTVTMVDPFLLNVLPYVGDTVPQDIYIPDNQDVNYVPIPVSIPLDINWDDFTYGDGTDTLTDAQAQEIADALDNAIIENPAKTLELADTAIPVPDPTEVYIPFLPVELPNFEFSLSGIWHYVRDWVASLGSWFSMVFTIWSHLPYAIVVPVYASAVIVIVLGVYRRFFM